MGDPKIRLFRLIGSTRRHRLEGLPLASFEERAKAFAIDLGLTVVFWIMISLPTLVAAKADRLGAVVSVANALSFLIFPLYFTLGLYYGHGQTFGKRCLRIRVLSLPDDDLSAWACLRRSVGYLLSILTGGIGFLQYFLHPNGQTLEDLLARTIVISEALLDKEDSTVPPEAEEDEGEAPLPDQAGA